MLNLELTIRPHTQTALPEHAQFVTGDNTQAWADEIVRWNVDDDQLRLIVIPRSRRDLKPVGVLVFYRDGSPLRIPRHLSSTKTVQYGLFGPQVFLPCDATVEPAISEREISKDLTQGRAYAWHPTSGLVAAGENDLLSVSDLFSVPEQILEAWDEAHCGTAWAKQLTSVAMLPAATPSATDALDGGKDDIGSKASEIESIEPVKDPAGQTGEPTNSPLGKAYEASMKGFASFIASLTSMAPSGSSNYTWVNKLEDWATGKLQDINERIEQQRFKELFRLQKLLEQNPEEGLQYALPLNSSDLSRGTAAPSSRLSRNQTNFSLSGLRGGGPADYWDVPEDLRAKLNRQYRELAEREINLGRYRRAAYIYGKLLSDLNAAARILEVGKHYREAAVLYQKKLHRNVDAARCLDKGGHWSELIALREELHQYEMAGDVYIKLGLEDEANAAFKRAVRQQFDQQNYIDAARIEEHKLANIDDALSTLEQGWPDSKQANLCVQEIFRVLGTAGRHEESKSWIKRIENEFPTATSQPDVLLTTVADLANKYPDQATREVAHESTFQIVSAALTDHPNLGRVFLGSIHELHPEDKLLTRDCSNYRSRNPRQKALPAPKHPAATESAPTLVTTFSLPSKVDWVEGTSLGEGYLLVGQKNHHVSILKLSADFKSLGTQTARLSNSSKANFSIAKTANNQRVIVHCPLDKQFGDKEIFATDDGATPTIVGSSWIDEGTIGITQGQNHQWFIVRLTDSNECLLEILSATGELMSSKPLELEFRELSIPVPICFVGSKTHIGIGRNLVNVNVSGDIEKVEFYNAVRSICGSVPGTMPRIALAFDNGVQVIWNKGEITSRPIICEEMLEPKTLFTRTGHLVIAADRVCEIYKTVNRQVQFVAVIEIDSCVRLMRSKESNQFAVLTESGDICVYQIPIR